MRRILLAAVGAVLLPAAFVLGAAWEAGSGARYESEQYGFRFVAPEFERVSDQTFAAFSGPVSDGFAPNLNVLCGAASTPAQFKEQTSGAFQKMGWTTDSDEQTTIDGVDAWRYSYHGKAANRDLRFMALAVFQKERTLVFTATATPKQFDGMKEKFAASFSSIVLAGSKK